MLALLCFVQNCDRIDELAKQDFHNSMNDHVLSARTVMTKRLFGAIDNFLIHLGRNF